MSRISYTAPGTPEDNKSILFDLWDSEQEYRETISIISDLYDGNQTKYFKPFMDESKAQQRKRPRFSARIFTKAVDLSARTYVRGVSRATPDMVEWDTRLWRNGKLNFALAEADRLSLMSGTSLIVMKEVDDPVVGPILKTFVVPGSRWVGLCSQDDPSELDCVLIAWSRRTSPSNKVGQSEIVEYLYLDSNISETIVDRSVTKSSAHNYGVLPAVALPNTISSMSFLGTPIGGRDMADAIITVGEFFEQAIYTALMSRGMVALFGDIKKADAVGPQVALEMDEGGRAESIRSGADIPGILSVYQTAINQLTSTWSLPPNFFNVVSIQPPSSAAVLQVSATELEAFLRDRQVLLRSWEDKIHYVASVILSKHGVLIGAGGVLVEYPTAPMIQTPAEFLSAQEFMLENNLITKYQAAVNMQPHKPPYLAIGGVDKAAENSAEMGGDDVDQG